MYKLLALSQTDTIFSLHNSFTMIKKILCTLMFFYHRQKTRRALALLDDDLLKDVGISRKQALEEIHKPFWQ